MFPIILSLQIHIIICKYALLFANTHYFYTTYSPIHTIVHLCALSTLTLKSEVSLWSLTLRLISICAHTTRSLQLCSTCVLITDRIPTPYRVLHTGSPTYGGSTQWPHSHPIHGAKYGPRLYRGFHTVILRTVGNHTGGAPCNPPVQWDSIQWPTYIMTRAWLHRGPMRTVSL